MANDFITNMLNLQKYPKCLNIIYLEYIIIFCNIADILYINRVNAYLRYSEIRKDVSTRIKTRYLI